MRETVVNGFKMFVDFRGQGPVLLLVHGFPLSSTMWIRQLEELSADCRVIAPDLRGFGRSETGPGVSTMAQMADDLAAMLDAMQVEGPVVFCGLSMGGYIGWQFLLRHRRRVRGLIACDTRAIADTPEAAAGRYKMIEQIESNGMNPLVEAMLPKLLSPEVASGNPDLVEFLRQMMASNRVAGSAAALRGLAERPDVSPRLGSIDVPTLLICGEKDAISSPDEMRGIAEAIPGAEFELVLRAGHMAPLENPDQVNAAIRRFMARIA